MNGIVFDIKEFALNDGDGIRTTVFLKGCPLRCIWCHNPEGLSPTRELLIKPNGCTDCGLCRIPCDHPECRGLGRCLHICPQNIPRAVGTVWESTALAEKLLRGESLLRNGGGVTLSGGEPLLQGAFCLELLGHLQGRLHRCIETSGYAEENLFQAVAKACEFVIMDIKLADPDAHKRYTGVGNAPILKNLEWLKRSGIPHLFRTPLIPGITDTAENLSAIANIVGDDRIELLAYNRLAGAKYASVGRRFTDEIDLSRANPQIDLSLFSNVTLRN